jgi:aryl-alcohol dehydrogenase-like predicted oxidoreductase
MEYLNLGRTGLKVSRLCLGCMTYGVPERGNHAWTLDEESSRPFIQKALEHGINFFDTANVYSDGTSEGIVGRALRDFAAREEVVVATKVHGRMRPGPNGAGLSRKAIFAEIEASLRRLDTDYVDLYQIHRWDSATPIEETLEALHDVVKAGHARYIGASSMHAWQFAKALFLADRHGWTRFVSMQNHYNLLYREEEREMMGLCATRTSASSPGVRWRAAASPATGTSKPSALRPTSSARPCTRRRPENRRARRASRAKSRRSQSPGRPGVDAFQAGCHRAYHRRLQAAPPGRRRGGPEPEAERGGNRRSRRAVCPTRRRRLLLKHFSRSVRRASTCAPHHA